MGAFLAKPKTEKENEHGSGNGIRFGLSSMQGWRVEMEDAHSAVLGLPHGLKDWSFFAVFDGHAGSKVAKYCSEHLLDEVTSTQEFKGTNKPTASIHPALENVRDGLRTGFLNIDKKLRSLPELHTGEDKSGSTAVCVLISPTHVFFANCGDSRGMLIRNGRPFIITDDHKPVKPAEKERIQNAGGSVMIQRVNGSLAVSRALGDFEYKNVEGRGPCEQLVSPEPEVLFDQRSEKDEFIVLACDGIWDVMSNDELCEFIRSRLLITDNLEFVCNQVIDTCLSKGSRDNMSIVVITFQNAPQVSEVARQKEAELDTRLENRVKEFLDNSNPGDVDFGHVMHALASEDIAGLPPGGGLAAKRNTVEDIFHKLNPTSKNDENAAEDVW
ncbi:protein phosphatase 1B-like [Saccoglossus kowalevskii]|uniref:Protein phosphatase 1B-like n=1 Tax=Saccoglossus kowalevskii TaxID=10224 RepID=A0ABM0GZG9_SACKO|nr:PREDICTED: protein phosphatase 1B-like [Saccoglossus kowalevskii]